MGVLAAHGCSLCSCMGCGGAEAAGGDASLTVAALRYQ
jgi:hypothetical protein